MASWYKDFYLATPEGEKELREALADPVNRADVERRFEEMKLISDDRCHITKKQRDFLGRILGVE